MTNKLEYKIITGGDLKQFSKMIDYAFFLPEGEKEYKSEEDYHDVLDTARALYRGKEILCCFVLFRLNCRIRGSWLKMGAIGGVATPPENRRKGYVKEMFKRALIKMRENNILLSSLWPFSYPFYRKLGYEHATAYKTYLIKPEQLRFAANYNSGEFRKASVDDYEKLNNVYRKHHKKYDLEIERSKGWWDKKVIKDNYVYILEKQGQSAGYIIYSAEEEPGEDSMLRMNVREIAAVDYDSYLECLRFLYNHDSQIHKIEFHVPTDDILLKFLSKPRIDNSYKSGAMFRIVDVRKLLSAIEYPPDYAGTIIFRVNDELLEYNNGVFELEIRDGEGECREIDNHRPDFEIDINHLAPVVTGYISPEQAARLNMIKTDDNQIIYKLEGAFPARKTYFLNFF